MADTRKGRRRCNTKTCRRLQEPGLDYCKACLQKQKQDRREALHADSPSLMMEEVERLQFVELHFKTQECVHQMRILQLEQAQADNIYNHEKRRRQEEQQAHKTRLHDHNSRYQQFLKGIAEKYGLDREYMSLDDETGMLVDLRGETAPPVGPNSSP